MEIIFVMLVFLAIGLVCAYFFNADNWEINGKLKKDAKIISVDSKTEGLRKTRRIRTYVRFDDGFVFSSCKSKNGFFMISVDAEIRDMIIQEAIKKHQELYDNQAPKEQQEVIVSNQQHVDNEFISTKKISNPFALCGSMTLDALWDDFVRGEHRAVDMFKAYTLYVSQLKESHSDIDFERVLTDLGNDNNVISLTSGHAMYLNLFDWDNEIYLLLDEASLDSFPMTCSELRNVLLLLNDDEIEYCSKLKEYINKNIRPLVEDVCKQLYGVNWCQQVLPVNTLELIRYHNYIREEKYFYYNNENSKWNRVKNSPVLSYKITKENPLVLLNITDIDMLVLDYLCYATAVHPSRNFDMVLNVGDPAILKTLIKQYGQGVEKVINNEMADINGYAFRCSVYNGVKIRKSRS